MWHFCNDERKFSYDPFKQKSEFDSKKKNVELHVCCLELHEFYLSCLEEGISSLDYILGCRDFCRDLSKQF